MGIPMTLARTLPQAASDGSAVQTLDQLLHHALEQLASDIHVESGEDYFRVRIRIDGQLQIAATPALSLRDSVVSRLKVLARMDIAEKRVPQDGRIQYAYKGQIVDLRVSSLPTLHGEKIVVRILNFSRTRPALATLGYEQDDCTKLIQSLKRPHGLILMTGPTGAGKTLSLYCCLELLNQTEVNISTVEDPSEIHLPGANQVNINERAGLTFATALRALLRQDPDIIMIGEIRDLETAEIAIQAAQTGHLVLSTLHTNDAPSTLARLHHMGVSSFNVAASVSLITAQRLIRRLCEQCKDVMTDDQAESTLSALHPQDIQYMAEHSSTGNKLYKAVGCANCDKGYKGRVGIYQVMPISDAMQALILRDHDTQALAAQAATEGIRTLRQAGWLKVLSGVTSVDEVMSLTTHG
jgi:type IV pilus assembly protein PilB